VLNSTKTTDIPNVLGSLAQNEQDTLMKYIYKGMGMPGWGDVSGSVLLGWHEKVCDPCMPPIYVHTKYTAAVDGSSGNGLRCTSNDRPKNRVTTAL
jgi:hypothetical protein